MKKLEHKTTEEHYNKYRNMGEKARINIKEFCNYNGYTVKNLRELYLEDNFLNNIPLINFDSYYHFFIKPDKNLRKIITHIADNVCCIKHLLIYEVLEAAPIFVENGENYSGHPPLKK